MSQQPDVIIVISGKRKSGKDYISEKLFNLIGDNKCALIRLSSPLKYQYAKENNLDYAQLLSSNDYKEQFRDDMIKWGERVRKQNPNYFCDLACSTGYGKQVWVITDARRPSDIKYFQQKINCQVYLVRIEADIEVRKNRGWKFVSGVDDCDSECALDFGVNWDFILKNNGNSIDCGLNELINILSKRSY